MDNSIIKAFLDNPVNGRLALSASFANFIKFFHWYMYHQEFIFRGFHLRIIKKLEDIAFGRASKKNLIINIPPRFGKSSIMKYFCAWSYMLNPHSNNIYTSYSDDLANTFSKDIRGIVESDAFKILTGVTLKKSKTGADYWETSEGGGFRAAPMGGAITGFGCFSYGTKVVTDTGIRSIGEIVSRREPVKFKCWNGKTEWKKPIKYIRNSDSEFLRIILNDGSVIDCTPDHRFYTQDGIKRADELTTHSIFPSNPFDSISRYSKFKHYIRNRVIFITDKLSLFFCGEVFINRGSFYPNTQTICFPSPIKTCFNIRNISMIKSVILGYFFIPSSVLCNFFGYLWRNFAIPVMCSVSNGISFIVRLSAIGKVFNRVIERISIKMPCNKSLWSFSYKGFCNKLMNSPIFLANTDKEVSLFRFPRLKDSRGFVIKASDSSERGNLVDSLIFRERKPVFIYKIGHYPSYCVTIPSNHNLFLVGSQEVLVGNSGTSTGEFGGCMLIDDPNKASSVKSQAELQNVVDYYLNTLKSRLNDQARTPIVLIMQRLSLDDLTGYLLENEADDWDWIKLQALDEDNGVALWEDKFPAKELIKLKNQSPFVYYGQYQQEPIVLGGSVIKTEWFKFYNTSEKYGYQLTWFTSDTAMKKGEGNDFSVLCFWGKTYDNRLHLIDMVRGKYDAEELRQQVILFWEKWKGFETIPYGYYIEDKASGIGIIQEIKKNYPIPVIPIARARHKDDKGMWVSMDKFSRCMTAMPYIANGWVYLPNSENDVISSVVLAETAAFKADLSHKHDDMCFVTGTMVSTLFGKKPIEKIKKGDLVITPLGIKRVLSSKCTGLNKVISKFGITATPNHKFYTKDGYKQFDNVYDLSECDKISLKGVLLWRYKKLLYSMESPTEEWVGREAITYLNHHVIVKEKGLKDFTLRFGNFIQERQFLKALLFITKTTTLLTTTSLIWSVYQGANILNYTKKTVLNGLIVKKVANTWTILENLRKSGIGAKKGENGTEKTLKNIKQVGERPKYAHNVEENLKPVVKQKYATGVTMPTIKERREDVRKTYNLTIEDDGVYYANDILVSNCDNLFDAIDIAFGSTGISSIFI